MSVTIVDRPLGNIATFDVGARIVERVVVPSDALAKRVLRLETSSGALGLRLEGARLRRGDVVFADAERVVVVEVEPERVLAIVPRSPREAFELGHLLGNRHWPALVSDDEIVLADDPAIARLLTERGIRFARELRRLDVPFRPPAAHEHAP